MNRREHIGALFVGLFGLMQGKLPQPKEDLHLVSDPLRQTYIPNADHKVYGGRSYRLGYAISKELIEDGGWHVYQELFDGHLRRVYVDGEEVWNNSLHERDNA